MPKEHSYASRIGQPIKVKAKLRNNRIVTMTGTLKETDVVFGRETVGVKMEGQAELQWFNADKVVK